MKIVNCIVCDRMFESALPDDGLRHNQPSSGLCFHAFGQYGTTVFDPMDGCYLEINVCDKCIVAAAERSAVLIGFRREYRGLDLVFWEPDEEAEPAKGQE